MAAAETAAAHANGPKPYGRVAKTASSEGLPETGPLVSYAGGYGTETVLDGALTLPAKSYATTT